MFDLLIMIICCTASAYVIETRTYSYDSVKIGIKRDLKSKFIYISILIVLILFAGLRSAYNDTSAYMHAFRILDAKSVEVSDLYSAYGGFEIFQKIIKLYISENPQMLIFISAVLTNLLFVHFIVKHTENICGSMLLYLIGNYMFSMAGIKQAIAIGIGLYAIDRFLNRRYFSAILLLLLAMTFHPYIICLTCILFLKDKIWNGKTILVIVVSILLFANLEQLFELISTIGKDYSETDFNSYTINPFRVLVEAVPIVISFIYRNKINATQDKILILGTNMNIIGFVFIFLGLFYNPIYLGRLSTYFTALSAITIPKMLRISFSNGRNEKPFIVGYYLFFVVYFFMDLTKIGSISLFYDQFRHVSIFGIF